MRFLLSLERTCLILVVAAAALLAMGCSRTPPQQAAPTPEKTGPPKPPTAPKPPGAESLPQEVVGPDDPRRKLETTIPYAINLMEKKQHREFAEKLLPLGSLRDMALQGSLRDLVNTMRIQQTRWNEFLGHLRTIRDKKVKPEFDKDRTTATFTYVREDPASTSTFRLVLSKSEHAWRFANESVEQEVKVDHTGVARLNSLRSIGFALENYAEKHGVYPVSSAIRGKPLLSWRVHLLPWLEHDDLYNKFRLDEPWNSEHNKQLLPEIPAEFSRAGLGAVKSGTTRVLAPACPGSVLAGGSPSSRADLAKIASQRIVVVVAGADKAVPWTRPDDLQIDPARPLDSLGKFQGGLIVLYANWTATKIRNPIDPARLLKMFGHAVTQPPGKNVPAGKLKPASKPTPARKKQPGDKNRSG